MFFASQCEPLWSTTLKGRLSGTVSASVLTVFVVLSAAAPAYADHGPTVLEQRVDQWVDQNISDSTLRSVFKDIANAAVANVGNVDKTTASGVVEGQLIDVTSPTAFRNLASLNKASGTVAGHAVTVATTASSFSARQTSATLTLVIDGVQIYNGSVKGLTEAIGLKAWNALGQTSSTTQTLVQEQTTREASQAIITGISERISFSLMPPPGKISREEKDKSGQQQSGNMVGLSAGDNGGNGKLSVWSNFSYNFLNNDNSLSKYDGNLITGLMGADYLIPSVAGVGGDLLLGVAISEEALSLNQTATFGTLDTTGTSLVPYLGYRMLGGKLVYDLLYAHTWLNSDMTANRAFAETSGSFGGERNAWASNLTYNHVLEDWVLSPSIGINYAHQNNEAFTNSVSALQASTDSYIADARIGGRISYAVTPEIEVYTSNYYAYDVVPIFDGKLRSCTAEGICDTVRGQVQSAIGSNLYQDQFYNIGDLVVSAELGHVFRDNTPSTSVTASARLSF